MNYFNGYSYNGHYYNNNAYEGNFDLQQRGGFGPPITPPGQNGGYGPPFTPPPGQQGGIAGPPSGPPPSQIPQQQTIGVQAVDPGAINGCLYRYVYIWPTIGFPYWAWLVYVGRRSIAGWRWTGFGWTYFGTDVNNISSFQCV